MNTTMRQAGGAILLAVLAGVSGCSTAKSLNLMTTRGERTILERSRPQDQPETIDAQASTEISQGPRSARIQQQSVPSLVGDGPAEDDNLPVSPPTFGVETVDAVVPPLPVPEFLDVVFGGMLKAPYSTGPGVAKRKDIIQLRSSGVMDAEVFYTLVTQALEEYGVRVFVEGGVFKIVEDSALKSRIPRFIKSRARAETPEDLRPLVQFVELNAVNAEDMVEILTQAFGERQKNLSIRADSTSNNIILSGLPDDVNAALAIIYQMDELQYAGTQAQRYSPLYWEARLLADELSRVLNAEGWQTSLNESQPKPILFLSVDYSNDLLIFSRTAQASERIAYWLRQLDRPSTEANKSQMFVYAVKHLDAAVLAETVNSVLQGGGGASLGDEPSEQQQLEELAARRARGGAAATSSGNSGSNAGGAFVVDPLGNRLIFSGTRRDYDRLRPLLEALDNPTPEVLIEVMIAQIQLTDSITSGVEWAVQRLKGTDVVSSFVQSGLGLGGGGLDVSLFPGDANVELNAFAENRQVDVLSTPRLVARSGSSASVQVGNEIPILSAQRASVGGGVDLDVISQVDYRSTGIILNIEPIVFSNNRIDLTLTQSVSAALPGTGPIASPSFSNTSVTTQLSLEDGSTAIIGGLIQDNVTRGERGIPFLKDIPLIGNVFSVRNMSVDRSELVILITAYVLRSPESKAELAARFSEQIDVTLATDNLVTLRPWRL